METKICKKCGEEKSIDYFRCRGEGSVKKRVDLNCRECDRKDALLRKELRETAPPIPQVCQCCGLDPLTNQNLSSFRKTLQLDHDHDTKKFRGWICDNCNVALARAGDDLKGAINLVNYLLSTL